VNRDFLELLEAIRAQGVRFIVIGAHALAAHGFPRATGDLDIWVSMEPENAKRVWRALVEFGAPVRGPRHLQSRFLDPRLGFSSLPPWRIEIAAPL
jgi:hypothetical protein